MPAHPVKSSPWPRAAPKANFPGVGVRGGTLPSHASARKKEVFFGIFKKRLDSIFSPKVHVADLRQGEGVLGW